MRNMNKLMKQAQKMQQGLMAAQEEAAKKEYEVTVGGGVVSVVMTGDNKLKKVKIDPEAAKDDVEMVEDMVIAAVNKAGEDIKKDMENVMGGLTGGMNLPF